MEWQQWGKRLVEVLGLQQAPVAVTYSDEAAAGATTESAVSAAHCARRQGAQ